MDERERIEDYFSNGVGGLRKEVFTYSYGAIREIEYPYDGDGTNYFRIKINVNVIVISAYEDISC